MYLSRLGSVLLTRRGVATGVGPVYSRNEDSRLASPPSFAVVDGMGGHVGGVLASSTTVCALEDRLSADTLGRRRADLADLSEGIRQVTQVVAALADPEDPMAVPGSTLMDVLVPDTERRSSWLSFNIGDSYIYTVGGDSIRQVIRDHSAVQEAHDSMELTDEELVFPPPNVVTRALGAGIVVTPDADYALVSLFQGDYALMCSDGVHGVLGDEMIVQVVRPGGEPQQIANELANVVITSGTRDNTTTAIVHISCASWAGDACEVYSRQIQAARPASTTTVRRDVNQEIGEVMLQLGRLSVRGIGATVVCEPLGMCCVGQDLADSTTDVV